MTADTPREPPVKRNARGAKDGNEPMSQVLMAICAVPKTPRSPCRNGQMVSQKERVVIAWLRADALMCQLIWHANSNVKYKPPLTAEV